MLGTTGKARRLYYKSMLVGERQGGGGGERRKSGKVEKYSTSARIGGRPVVGTEKCLEEKKKRIINE